MAEEHRTRKRKLSLWLLEDELDLLTKKAEKIKVSKSEYIRMLIAYGGIKGWGVTNFSKEDAKKIRYELSSIGNNINQIAYRVNSKATVDEEDVNELRAHFVKYLGLFNEFVTR